MREIDELKEVYNRLQAWAENERLWASRMPDGLEADANLNRAKNYEWMLPKIEAAINALRPAASDAVNVTGAESKISVTRASISNEELVQIPDNLLDAYDEAAEDAIGSGALKKLKNAEAAIGRHLIKNLYDYWRQGPSALEKQ